MDLRIIWFRRLTVVGFGILVMGLAYLQLVKGSAYRSVAERNRLRLMPQPAARGLLLDRVGQRLATNRRVFRVAAVPQELHHPNAVFARLGGLLGIPPGELERRFHTQHSLPFLPVALTANIPKPLALRIEEERVGLPGILVESAVTRHYPFGSTAAHLIGYLSQPSPEAFPTLKQYGVRAQELVGRTGLERELDAYLRGRSGGSLVEVDHRARQVRVIGFRQPIAGVPVTVTIDARLSALIEQQFGQQPGACVVLHPDTGEVLAMVSVPSFDPEAFAIQDQGAIQRFLRDEERTPLRNRATLGAYTPGSIAKLVTAAMALESRLISPHTAVRCTGSLTIGDRQFHCWNRDGHGVVTLREALTVSCNVYFMEVGRRLGVERLRKGLTSVGFGRRTGWPLEEHPGVLPLTRRLSEGEVALLAMGQGEILITVLQAAVMASALANGGWLVEPWAVKAIQERPSARVHLVSLGWSDNTLASIRTGMLAVVNDPQGTGIRARSERVTIAGKTATAQTHLPGQPHGWFVGFCPFEEPRAAFAIVAEHGGSGGELPAKMAKTICEYAAGQPQDLGQRP